MATVDYRLCGAVYPSLDRYCNEHLLENIKGSLHPNYKETYCLTYLCELGEALSVGHRKGVRCRSGLLGRELPSWVTVS